MTAQEAKKKSIQNYPCIREIEAAISELESAIEEAALAGKCEIQKKIFVNPDDAVQIQGALKYYFENLGYHISFENDLRSCYRRKLRPNIDVKIWW